ncbi:MAG: hypothetical protein NVS2B11_10320 [Acetobacteraceae bacterium]
MNRSNNPTQPLSLEPQADEASIRRALGLGGATTTHQQRPEQARQRHRFVADGAVPVVMLNRTDSEASSLKEKLGALDVQLETERAAHASTRRALQEAQAACQALQTRLAHTQIAHGEALASEREARRLADEALAEARANLAAAAASAAPLAAMQAKPAKPKREYRASAATRELKPATREPKPVRWWTTSYRAKTS